MITSLILVSALALDAILGDPAWRFHPVRLMGALASRVEAWLRNCGSGRIHGFAAWLVVTSLSVFAALVASLFGHRLHFAVGTAVDVCLVYFTIAPRDLTRHAQRVQNALAIGDLVGARRAVGHIVGRDTEVLETADVSRAAIEAVAESTVDGVTAPLFWAALLGPLGAVLYRAVNTLDSMWGHHDERYEHFGFIAAKSDDLANYLPARLSVIWICAAALLLHLRVSDAWRAARQHGKRHASPNSGLSEAAFAGALGVMLGGKNRYDGQWHDGPSFGFLERSVTPETIRHSIRLMWFTTLIAIAFLTAGLLMLRWLVT
jgi:adenosylcobinamide-phosphate synthase